MENMKCEILSILKELRPDGYFRQSEDFLSDGLLDSYDIISFVVRAEKILGIVIDGEDVRPENFKNLDSLAALCQKK